MSVIAVTENRHAFIPWLYAQFKKQSLPDSELVIVDSSRHGIEAPKDERVTVIRAIPGTSIGAKVNVGIEVARGDFITRWDDDDWQHPTQLARKVTALTQVPYGVVGFNHGYFVDLGTYRVYPYRGLAGWLVPLTCAFPRELGRALPFPNKSAYEDTEWMQGVLTRVRPIELPRDFIHSFWLRHSSNTIPRFFKHPKPFDLYDLVERIGLEDWGDSGELLAELKNRLYSRPSA